MKICPLFSSVPIEASVAHSERLWVEGQLSPGLGAVATKQTAAQIAMMTTIEKSESLSFFKKQIK